MKDINMENVLFESEIFNKDMKGMHPFRIRVTETITESTHRIEVIREEFERIEDNYVVCA